MATPPLAMLELSTRDDGLNGSSESVGLRLSGIVDGSQSNSRFGNSRPSMVFPRAGLANACKNVGTVVPDWVYFAGERDVNNVANAQLRRITAFLAVAEEVHMPAYVTPHDLEGGAVRFAHIPMRDDATTDLRNHFRRAFGFIDSCRNEGRRVIIYCQKGQSRSASIAAAYLMREEMIGYEAALDRLREHRKADPHFLFCQQLDAFYQDGFRVPGSSVTSTSFLSKSPVSNQSRPNLASVSVTPQSSPFVLVPITPARDGTRPPLQLPSRPQPSYLLHVIPATNGSFDATCLSQFRSLDPNASASTTTPPQNAIAATQVSFGTSSASVVRGTTRATNLADVSHAPTVASTHAPQSAEQSMAGSARRRTMEASLLTNPGDLMGDEEFTLTPQALAPVPTLFDADIPHTTSQNSGILVPDVFVDTVNTTTEGSNGVDNTSSGHGGDPEEVDYNAVRDILAISGIIDQSGALRMEINAPELE
jgi:protein-tyrosine phosphatase